MYVLLYLIDCDNKVTFIHFKITNIFQRSMTEAPLTSVNM